MCVIRINGEVHHIYNSMLTAIYFADPFVSIKETDTTKYAPHALTFNEYIQWRREQVDK